MTIKATGDRVVVEREPAAETVGSLVVPEVVQAREKGRISTVISVGPKVRDIKEGDRIWHGRFAGQFAEHNGTRLHIMRAHEIYAVLGEEEEIGYYPPPDRPLL